MTPVSKPVWHIPLLCVQWKTPDDGQGNCLKHVEFYSKNKFEKLMHLVGFIIRIYHDARSAERQVGIGYPSWSCSQAVGKPVWHIPFLCVQWKTPDDRQRNCPKHVEFYSKNKFEKLVHLVGFVVRIYHDAGHLNVKYVVRTTWKYNTLWKCIAKFIVTLWSLRNTITVPSKFVESSSRIHSEAVRTMTVLSLISNDA